jgi:hypothetical protein
MKNIEGLGTSITKVPGPRERMKEQFQGYLRQVQNVFIHFKKLPTCYVIFTVFHNYLFLITQEHSCMNSQHLKF